MSDYVPGAGYGYAKLMIVGEAPGAEEERLGLPFVGPSGKLVDAMLLEAGIKRSEVYVTNVVKHRPPQNKLYRLGEIGHTIEEYYPQLWEEIWAVKPNCILALGNVSLKALTGKVGVHKWRGSILPSIHVLPKVVSTFHPANLLKMNEDSSVFKYSSRVLMQHDFGRAVAQSKFPQYNPPRRTLEIGRSAAELWRFFNTYAERRVCAVDIEVIRAIPCCISFAFTPHHAMSVPLIDLWALQGREGIPKHELARIIVMVAEFLARKDIKVVGQNFKFDHKQLLDVWGIDVANVWFDVMLAWHSLYPELEKKLGVVSSIVTEEPYYKDDGKEFNLKKDDVEKFMIYNARDAAVEYECATELLKEMKEHKVPHFPNWRQEFFFDLMMPMHQAYLEMERIGIPVDMAERKRLTKEYKHKILVAQTRLNEIAGWPVNVNSNGRKGDVCKLCEITLNLPRRDSYKRENIVALHGNHCKSPLQKEALDLVLTLRTMRKALSTYFLAKPDYDGRMRTGYKLTGTETGRTSTTLLKSPVRPEKLCLAFQTMTKHGDIGSELRSYFVVDEGHVLLEADQSQAEARVVALLAEDYELLKLFDTVDIHKLTASWLFECQMKVITKNQRFIGKTTRHAGAYGMHKRRLMLNMNTMMKRFKIDMDPVSEWRAGKYLEKFHQFSPKIRGDRDRGLPGYHIFVEDTLLKNNMALVNPFGRYRQFMDRWGDELLREAFAYIPQSTVGDQTKKALLYIRREAPWMKVVLEAHDALVAMVPEERLAEAAKVMKAGFEQPIDFSRCSIPRGKLVIPCEMKVGRKNYKDLVDYRLPEEVAA